MFLAAAAAVVLVAGAIFRQHHSHGAQSTAEISAITTAVGALDSLRLPDGSRVVLGPGSRLVVAAGYGNESRDVSLSGEAFFDVVHDESRPFVVNAGGARIRDVGTAFSVRADSGAIRVVVASGSVEMAGVDSGVVGVVLHAGDIGVRTDIGGITAHHGDAAAEDMAWTRGKIVFRDATLAEVAAEIRRWYGVELVIGDSSLGGRHLTATFNRGDAVDIVLQNIALSLPASIDRNGNTAVVSKLPKGNDRR
jgi:transmembrane sensor